ncbi:hypothetical protein [Thalassotalea sp. G20_0]|nr:hypothetical protein [Thalassotalea sp. G20_0]
MQQIQLIKSANKKKIAKTEHKERCGGYSDLLLTIQIALGLCLS